MEIKPLQYYIDRYHQGTITAGEWKELRLIIEDPQNASVIAEVMDKGFDGLSTAVDEFPAVTKRVVQGIKTKIELEPRPLTHRVHFLRTTWFRYAAAIILIITGIALYYNFSHTSRPETAVVQNVPPASGEDDVLPGFSRAVLTLSNGQKVELDSAASETIQDGTLSIENINGRLKYSASGTLSPAGGGGSREARDGGGPGASNTMTTPRGGQYQLTLSDGTRVWLNAASSITYPTVFSGNIREVTITGEAYFEIKKNPSKPFVVKTPKEDITVLGTEFNVNAYPDETAVKTSLVEGSVKIADKILKPGQACINGKVVTTNIEQDVAWKNGLFSFDRTSLQTVMKQLSRWYNVEVIYEGRIPSRTFSGEIGRDLTLSQVLSGLSKTKINYRMESPNRLIILP